MPNKLYIETRDYSTPSTLFFLNNYRCNYTVLLRGLVEKAKRKWLRVEFDTREKKNTILNNHFERKLWKVIQRKHCVQKWREYRGNEKRKYCKDARTTIIILMDKSWETCPILADWNIVEKKWNHETNQSQRFISIEEIAKHVVWRFRVKRIRWKERNKMDKNG